MKSAREKAQRLSRTGAERTGHHGETHHDRAGKEKKVVEEFRQTFLLLHKRTGAYVLILIKHISQVTPRTNDDARTYVGKRIIATAIITYTSSNNC